MKIINENLFSALLQYRLKCGSNNAEMGRRLEISKVHIGRIMNEKINYFEDATWERIQPILQPLIDAVTRSNVRPIDGKGWRRVKIISLAAADTIDNNILPDYVKEHSDDEICFFGAKERDFAVEITGDSMCPWYPSGSIVLCRDTLPKHGDRVVVQMADHTVVFKVFAVKDNNYYLLSINSKFGGKDFIVNDDVMKIYPIIMSLRNERDIDTEMAKHCVQHSWKKRLEKL